MARPIKWARDLHALRERATRSRTETWSRPDIEQLFVVGRASAQTLMKAIGSVQAVGAAHFVERASLLSFLDEMLAAASVEDALRNRLLAAQPVPKKKALSVALSEDLRHAMLPDLAGNVTLSPGRIVITADTAVGMVEALLSLALVMQNDLDRWQRAIEPPAAPARASDDELKLFLQQLRQSNAPPAGTQG